MTPREEAIEILEQMKSTFQKDEWMEKDIMALEMAIRDMKMEQRWIPISERLPEDDCIVMISIHEDPIDYVSTGFYDNGFEMWLDPYEEMVNVMAWMPLPKPFKAGSGIEEAE